MNDEAAYAECKYYLDHLLVPEGYEIYVLTITEAPSMAAGYNAGMQSTDARYKVCMHQDMLIGAKHLDNDAKMVMNWDIGKLLHNCSPSRLEYEMENTLYQEVEAEDGLLLITRFDVQWREDIFDGWDYYDISQCTEFLRRRKMVVVPYQAEPWVWHDNLYSKMGRYYDYAEIFAKEYSDIHAFVNIPVSGKIREYHELKEKMRKEMLHLVDCGKRKEVVELFRNPVNRGYLHLKEIQILADIEYLETVHGAEQRLWGESDSAETLLKKIRKIKYMLKRIEFGWIRTADDAAGLAMSEKLRWMIRGLNQGTDNTMDGISWLQIGDGAMSEIDDMIHRITELSVKGANGTLTDDDRLMIDTEIQQLKKQINAIGRNTSFNEIPVFDNSNLCLDVYGAADDLQVFDSYYDDVTGEFAFGGVVFLGERITWDKIDPDMVKLDPDTGKDVFQEGTYTITSQSGRTLQIICEEGAEIPDFRVKKNISTDPNGIIIDNELFPWEELLDEDGNPCSPDNIHGGGWGVNYHGAIFSFYVPDEISSYDELSEALLQANNEKAPYVWETYYVGDRSEQAVDPYFSFDFTLSEITSVDSVIDGLDGMKIGQKNIATDYVPNINIRY